MFTLFTKAATGFGALIGSLVLMSGTASASCGGLFCANGGTPTLAPISSYGSTSYSHSGAASNSAYTGYTSGSYSSGGSQIIPFSGMPQGLGPNESLVPTNCPVNVHNPDGGEVLGCYSVVKPRPPVQVQNYVRVVRPIIYVRYPVPVQVPTCGINAGYGSSHSYSHGSSLGGSLGGGYSRYGNAYSYGNSYGYGQRGGCGR